MASASTSREWPNILVTGTPGTGKSCHCSTLQEQCPDVPLQYINIGDLVKEKSLYEEYNEEWQVYDVDEDKLLDELETVCGSSTGGVLLDWHACDLFPERWIDLVVVLRCDHTVLWNRLEKRNYALKKIQENNEAEIMGVIAEDARGSYAEEIVVELASEKPDDIESNVARIKEWITNWKADQERASS